LLCSLPPVENMQKPIISVIISSIEKRFKGD
jgi:hypothetical protein